MMLAVCLCMAAVLLVIGAAEVHGHSLFNSAEKFYGGFRVQVATAPEFPQIGEPSMLRVRVTDENFEEVDRFTVGIRFHYNGIQVDGIPPQTHEEGHLDMEYVWEREGNHIVEVDLYDMNEEGEILTYTFNMGTQSPFGYIFISAITTGAFTFTGIMIYIYLPKIRRRYRQA